MKNFLQLESETKNEKGSSSAQVAEAYASGKSDFNTGCCWEILSMHAACDIVTSAKSEAEVVLLKYISFGFLLTVIF